MSSVTKYTHSVNTPVGTNFTKHENFCTNFKKIQKFHNLYTNSKTRLLQSNISLTTLGDIDKSFLPMCDHLVSPVSELCCSSEAGVASTQHCHTCHPNDTAAATAADSAATAGGGIASSARAVGGGAYILSN